MAIEGNSQKSKETQTPEKKNRVLKPVADGSVDKPKTGFIQKWLSRDGDTIKGFIIETIVIPGLIDGISGIGDIIIESFTDGISRIFEKQGFLSDSGRSKSGSTSYSSISKKKRRRHRDDDDEYDDYEEHSYSNVRVKSRQKAEDVIDKMKDQIDELGCVTVANLYELTNNSDIVCHTDHRYGWTKLSRKNSDYYLKTNHRERPYLIRLPEPKDLKDF